LRRIAIASIAAALAAVAVVLALGQRSAVRGIQPGSAIAVSASLDPSSAQFGDRILARVVIELDRRAVSPETLRYTTGLAPLTQLGPSRTTRVVRGDAEFVTEMVAVACLSEPCAKRSGVTTIVLPPVRASVARRDGRRESVASAWPKLAVRGRVLAGDLASSQPAFEADTSPLAPTYSVSPTALAAVLDVLAVLLALAAVALLAWQAVARSRRRPGQRIDALARALRLALEARNGPVGDRRRALELLVRLLGRDRLAGAASDLAWSAPPPQGDEVEALVSEIERGRQP
jgi:hypothetical protein